MGGSVFLRHIIALMIQDNINATLSLHKQYYISTFDHHVTKPLTSKFVGLITFTPDASLNSINYFLIRWNAARAIMLSDDLSCYFDESM